MIKRTYVEPVEKELTSAEYRTAYVKLFPGGMDETLCGILNSFPLYGYYSPMNNTTRIKIYRLVKEAYESGSRKFSIQYVYDGNKTLVAWILVQE